MSAWQPKAAPATFRGVPFFVDTGERSGGRQTVSHEYPFSEAAAYTEDLGLKGRAFTVEGYVLGKEYEAARDALIGALEKTGPGELVHPYFGTRRVAVENYRVRQARAEGGTAAFSMEFRETTTEPVKPSTVTDVRAVVGSKVDAAKSAAASAYVAVHSTAVGAFSAATDQMQAILEANPVSPAERAKFARLVSTLGGAADVVGILESTFDALRAALGAAVNLSAQILGLFDYDPGPRPAGSTPERIADQVDYDANRHLVQRLAISGAATAVLDQVFLAYEDAASARTAITDKIDEHVEAVTDDTYPAMIDLRSALVQAVPGPDSDLLRIQTYTPGATLPSLVLAHQLYGNLDHEEDLIRRNGIRHPGFVPGGEALSVLSDG